MSPLQCLSSTSLEASAFSHQLPAEFEIGDRVSSECLDGKSGEIVTEFGEIVDCRWLPERLSWVYYINWTHSSCESDCCYPDCDGELVAASFLKLEVSHHV